MTNREWLESLSNEEFLEKIEHLNGKVSCKLCFAGKLCNEEEREDKGCPEIIAEWLQKEHEEELKPCPFCGGEAKIIDGGESTSFPYVYCTSCGTRSGYRLSEEDTIMAWNKRVD